jgi:hypothetical protein
MDAIRNQQVFPDLPTWMAKNGETAGVITLRQGLEGTLCMHAISFYHLSPLIYRPSGFKKSFGMLVRGHNIVFSVQEVKLIQ